MKWAPLAMRRARCRPCRASLLPSNYYYRANAWSSPRQHLPSKSASAAQSGSHQTRWIMTRVGIAWPWIKVQTNNSNRETWASWPSKSTWRRRCWHLSHFKPPRSENFWSLIEAHLRTLLLSIWACIGKERPVTQPIDFNNCSTKITIVVGRVMRVRRSMMMEI